MKKLIALLLVGIIPLMAQASGIGGGGSGVHGVGTRLPANIGVGISPYSWSTSAPIFKTIDIGTLMSISSDDTDGYAQLGFNAYYDGSNWVYKTTAGAGLIEGPPSGGVIIHSAASGTAGSTISWTNTTIAADGTVTSNKACASGYTRLTPNYCYFNNGHAGTVLGTGTSGTVACPSGATAVMVNLDGKTGSTVGAASSDNLHAHQFVQVSSDYAQGIVPCNAGNWYWVSTLSSALNYVVLGYFD